LLADRFGHGIVCRRRSFADRVGGGLFGRVVDGGRGWGVAGIVVVRFVGVIAAKRIVGKRIVGKRIA
jgi:hypothetical protein